MKRIILAAAIAAILGFSAPATSSQSQDPEQVEKVRDPVCRMMVKKDPDISFRHAGVTYYFCMRADLIAFQKDPERYLRTQGHVH